ncbi:MAG: hypothetical protein K0Q50_1839 [Vampirovibrio sp.]|nr:hypothetical protein [Vampirovibrio sp.]
MPNSINRSRRRHSLYYPERLANLWGAALWFSKNAIESYKTVYRKCYNLNPKREVDFDCEKIKVGWSKMKVSGLDFNFIESPNARALTICVELK